MPIEQHPFTSNRWIQHINIPLLESKWIINKNIDDEITSFGYIPSKDVKSIFLGSFPIWEITVGPFGSRNFEFFYGSKVNDFWNCLGFIFGTPVDNLENRISILNNLNIGITDILQTVNRNPANCNSDICLQSIKYNDILHLKESFPALKNIFITSGGKSPVGSLVNQKNVATWFKDSVKDQNIQGFNTKGFVKNISINNIEFNLIYLFSPAHSANTARQGEINRNAQFGLKSLDIQEFRRLQWGYFIKKYHLAESKNENIDNLYERVLSYPKLLDYFSI